MARRNFLSFDDGTDATMNKSKLLLLSIGRVIAIALIGWLAVAAEAESSRGLNCNLAEIDRARILKAAEIALKAEPLTITKFRAKLSEGGANDFYSNADYFWPDPTKPDGLPYINRDGESNPNNFNEHRMAMRELRDAVAALAAAYKITGDDHYVEKAVGLLRVFFIDRDTRMNPHLQYAQAVPGRSSGRSYGIIDGLHLVEIPVAIEAMQSSQAFPVADLAALKKWFGEMADWMMTSKNGQTEAAAKNNHSVAFFVQIAVFARFVGDEPKLAECRRQFKEVFVPNQMATNGSFPLELNRTKPYAYSIFQLDNMATLCQVLSTSEEDLWRFKLLDGRGIKVAMEFLYPFLEDKSKWNHPPDVQAWESWPTRQSSLLFAGLALHETNYLGLWKKLPPDPEDAEVRRNNPITQPILWVRDSKTQAATENNSTRPRVVAYVPNWIDLNSFVEKIDYAKLTHINIAFENPVNASGELSFNRKNDALIARAHANNVKVLISIGGGSASDDAVLKRRYSELMADSKRARFASNLVAYVVAHEFDGLDVDIEGPSINDDYGAFIEALAKPMKASGKLLTAALSQGYGGEKVPASALTHFDFVNIMAYDGTGTWAPNSPGQHSSFAYATNNVAYWVARGLPKGKAVLGVPFYGYGFGEAYRKRDYSYSEIVRAYPEAENADQVGKTIWYNGIPTIKAKTQYVVDEHLGGVMIWSLDYDVAGEKSLLSAIDSVLSKSSTAQEASPTKFKVLAFYTGQRDRAHISFVQEANSWFSEMARQHDFIYEATTNWNRLNPDELSSSRVVLFLDTRPEDTVQRKAFQDYMEQGGAWMGFHFAGFALTPSDCPQNWDWYHNEFLGSGVYVGNTWRPTSAVLKVEDGAHPVTKGLPETFHSAPNEWYKWAVDLRTNRDISILLAIDPSSFPLGTGPKLHEIWHDGYYPVVWTNKRYRMLYVNMGHNDIDYGHPGEKELSHTFTSAMQSKLVLNGLMWLAQRRD